MKSAEEFGKEIFKNNTIPKCFWTCFVFIYSILIIEKYFEWFEEDRKRFREESRKMLGLSKEDIENARN